MERYSVRGQARRGIRIGGLVVLATAGVLVVIYLITRLVDIPYSDLTRDAAATLEGPWYTGALSNSAIALLLVGAGIAVFAASLLPDVSGRSRKGLLNGLALVVIVFAADDLFMLHEAVYPEFGISSELAFAIYGLAMLAIIWIWRDVILRASDWVYLLLAALALGVSVVIDVVLEQGLLDLPFSGELIEDPAKILGMVLMSLYLVTTARTALIDSPAAELSEPPSR